MFVCVHECMCVCVLCGNCFCVHACMCDVSSILYIPHRKYVLIIKTKGRMVIVCVGSVCALQIQSTSMEPVSTK